MKSKRIPKATIGRLAVYVQVLESLRRDRVEVVSSEKLAQACSVNSSQIRKDLAYFGEFGVRGVGYYIQELITSIKRSLGIDRVWNCALVGVGNLGRALMKHRDIPRKGFVIKAAFDCDPDRIGLVIKGIEVMCLSRIKEVVPSLDVEVGFISTPPERAQRAANFLIEAGVRGIVTFAPARLEVPANIPVEYVDFSHHLYAVAFYINQEANKA
ncbi:MAG: redox-sensing transcriptional repressor Rex [Desulfovibrionaceae bacterium]|nr:redox-sensing transcriptional repressor Rex [Desulfovibrionaceae bacterium]